MSLSSLTTMYFRPALHALLPRILEFPLTVVEAPMGYGKTTAVREFAKTSGALVLWETLDNSSLTVFWRKLVRSLQEVSPAGSAKLHKMGFPGSHLLLDAALEVMADIHFPAETILVIDDYHILLSEDADRFIELLVKAELSNLHIVLISRVGLGDLTTELILKGYCLLIDRHCLELSKAESVEYYKKCGVRLTAQEAELLYSYTEGWISALYLCLLSYWQDGRIERQASLHELIGKVVYRNCTEEIREFLLNVCIFDNFSLQQAEMMWPQGNAKLILRRLTQTNAFIAFDLTSRMYQAHNILTSFLREIFTEKGLDQQREVWKRAGLWYMHAGEYLLAMESFHKADDSDSVLLALETDKGLRLSMEAKEKLIDFFESCPEDVKKAHPRACMIYAMNMYSFNEMAVFVQECQWIANNLDEFMKYGDGITAKQLAGELELLSSFSAYNNITAMSVHIRKAAELLQTTSEFYDRNSPWTFEAPSVLYMFHREPGKLVHEVRDFAQAAPDYYRITDGHGAGAEYVLQAEQHYYCGELDQAEILSHTALHAARAAEQPALSICALFVQLRLALVRGNAVSATQALRQIREEAQKGGVAPYFRMLDLCEGFLFNFLRQPLKMPSWIAEGDALKSQLPFPSYAFLHILYGHYLLRRGEECKLLGMMAYFEEVASVFPNLLGQIYNHIFTAIAQFRLRRSREAEKSLLLALDQSMPDGLLMPFVECGEELGSMLAEARGNIQYRTFIDEINQLYSVCSSSMAIIRKTLSDSDSAIVPLTDREKEIAELVASGLSSQLIGRELFITEVTVKKALKNIYSKLGINNRAALIKIMIEDRNRQSVN